MVEDGSMHPGLTECEVYYVIGVQEEDYRVLNDRGSPILYPKILFEVVNNRIPPGWVFRDLSPEDTYYLEPEIVASRGFFERYHNSDGDVAAALAARRSLADYLSGLLEDSTSDERAILMRDLSRLEVQKTEV